MVRDTLECSICEEEIADIPVYNPDTKHYESKQGSYESLSDFYNEVTALWDEGKEIFICEGCVEFAHKMIEKNKLQPKVYRIWEGYSNESTGDRSEIYRVVARNMNEALRWVRKNLHLPRDAQLDGDDETTVLEWYRKRNDSTHYIQIEQTNYTDPLSKGLPPFDAIDTFNLVTG